MRASLHLSIEIFHAHCGIDATTTGVFNNFSIGFVASPGIAALFNHYFSTLILGILELSTALPCWRCPWHHLIR